MLFYGPYLFGIALQLELFLVSVRTTALTRLIQAHTIKHAVAFVVLTIITLSDLFGLLSYIASPTIPTIRKLTSTLVRVISPVTSLMSRAGARIERYIEGIPRNARRNLRRQHVFASRRIIRSQYGKSLTRLVAMAVVFSSTTNQVAPHQTPFDTDAIPLYIDNCATSCVTNKKSLCVGPRTRIKRKVTGINGTFLPNIYMTDILFEFEDDMGETTKHLVKNGFLIESAPNCLLSPQHWSQSKNDHFPEPNGTSCITYDKSIVLKWDQNTRTRTIPLHIKGANVGIIYTTPSINAYSAFMDRMDVDQELDQDLCPYEIFCQEANVIPPDDDEPSEEAPSVSAAQLDDEQSDQYFPERDQPLSVEFNLEGPEASTQEPAPISRTTASSNRVHVVDPDEEDSLKSDLRHLLILHHRYGHLSFKKLKHLAIQGVIPKRLASVPPPLCTACLCGKATRKPWRTKPSSKEKSSQVPITAPGQCVSVDQLISTTPGYVPQLRGIPTKQRYRVATVFVDHFSGLSYVVNQYSSNADETIVAKRKFEEYASRHGVIVRHYHADNGIFADNKFRAAVREDKQTLSFCGVNSHWQNGKAERRIRELQETTRTMLIHAIRRWPSAVTPHLWPLALRYANDMHAHAPQSSGKPSPLELFSGSKVWWNPLHSHTFGCPVYVLDNGLQAGKKISKWAERTRVGIFLGHSPEHARTVSLVLSLTSGLTSPQFHCKYDETFQTIKSSFGNDPPTSKWQRICGFTSIRRSKTDKEPTSSVRAALRSATTAPLPTQVTSPPEGASEGATTNEAPLGSLYDESGRRYSARRQASNIDIAFEATCAIFALQTITTPLIEEQEPIRAFAASADPDTMYMHEAMRQPDRLEFIKAAWEEIKAHTLNGLWKVVPRSSVPKGTPIGRGVWSMKRKRRIDTGEIYKWKARLAFDGSKQVKGVNFWETFAPVTSWPIVRFVLTLVLVHGWSAVQIDFELAYTQADAEVTMFMEMPKGFNVDGKDPSDNVLQILKNYYGEKQAGRVWYLHLDEKLRSIGFVKSKFDDCLYYRGRCIYILYTDDSLLVGPSQSEIDDIIRDMRAADLKLTTEGGLGDFLGVKIERKSDGTVHLTQPHLIDSILKDLRLDDGRAKPVPTPALVTKTLRNFDKEPDFDNSFGYSSVIGKLNYLEKCTRPDIAFAAHQCARFSKQPKKSHGVAVRHIGRYLLGTRDKGIILKPLSEQSFDVYVDSDFAGNFTKEESHHRDSARSRYGFIITYAGCPVYWCSKLATEIALSTTEAEYIGLSQALRTAIPLMNIAKEMKQLGFDVQGTKPNVHCRVFEDNSGAIELATNHKFRPRTRHIAVRYHHFRHHVSKGRISIHKIDSASMPADQLTKPVPEDVLRRHRLTLQGWDLPVQPRRTSPRGSVQIPRVRSPRVQDSDEDSVATAPTSNRRGSVTN